MAAPDFNRLTNGKYQNPSFIYPLNLGQVGQEPFMIFEIRDSVKVEREPLGTLGLYMPATLKVTYNANYSEIQDIVRKFENAGLIGDAQAAFNALAGGNGSDFSTAIANFGNYVGQTITSTSTRSQLEFQARRLINPHSTMAFNGMSFRSFQFDYQMMAKSAAESEAINNIIYNFKLHMHPGVESGGVDTARFLTYPENFNIGLFSPTNKYLFNIGTCFLTDMEVDYAGSGVPSFFGGTGAPVDVRMSLRFVETFQVSKNEIRKGL